MAKEHARKQTAAYRIIRTGHYVPLPFTINDGHGKVENSVVLIPNALHDLGANPAARTPLQAVQGHERLQRAALLGLLPNAFHRATHYVNAVVVTLGNIVAATTRSSNNLPSRKQFTDFAPFNAVEHALLAIDQNGPRPQVLDVALSVGFGQGGRIHVGEKAAEGFVVVGLCPPSPAPFGGCLAAAPFPSPIVRC